MRVRFLMRMAGVRSKAVDVEYAAEQMPQVGDRIESDGDDPQFPGGLFIVVQRTWLVDHRGVRGAVCELEPK